MQCPNCQRDNLPGATVCFYCGASLSAPQKKQSFMPPRADRKEPAGIIAREAPKIFLRERLPSLDLSRLNFTIRDLCAIIFGFVPGLSAFLFQKKRLALYNLAIGISLIAGIILSWHFAFSNFCLFLLCALFFAGFIQALWFFTQKQGFPLSWETLSAIILISASLFILELSLGYLILIHWFFLFNLRTNQYMPYFSTTDTIIARRNYYKNKEPEFGDVAVWGYLDRQNPLYLARINGIPGDQIEIEGRNILVNGKELAPENQPLNPLPVPVNFSITVPENRYFTSTLYYTVVQGDVQYLPSAEGWFKGTRQNSNQAIAFYFPSRQELQHKVVYTLFPAYRRRKW